MMLGSNVIVSFDEFIKKQTFVVTYLMTRTAVLLPFMGEWNRLRNDMRAVLLRDYPAAANDPTLRSGALPEIHAEPMYNSNGVYRKYPKGREPEADRFYWHQHHAWLERALGIIKKYQVGFYTGFIYYKDRNFNTLPPKVQAELGANFRQFFQLFATLYPEYPNLYNQPKLSQLSNDPYFYHLAMTLPVVNNYLEKRGLSGEMICDVRSKYGHWFENTEVFDELKRSGYFLHLAPPRFLKSQKSELLQAADLVGYVAGQHYHAEESRVPNPDETMNRWWREYVEDLRLNDTPDLQETQEGPKALAIMLEVAAETCIFDLRLRSEFKGFYRWLLAQLMAGVPIDEAFDRLQWELEPPTS